ncbi:hypothetical protein BWP39_27585 [Paraburkholderia acidicola]|uniref:OmpA-like domain-containing protein n=2 Tax=Paraburkholderia acidicola TaxID=1912599 RepID=A0A2A4ET19_9BURK|nr:hypothetical protein BWP39_27585 [Paraburkholderia acidicola]
MKKIALCWFVLAAALTGCTASSGPTFTAYSIDMPGHPKAYRVECGGIFENSNNCMKTAQHICGDQPVQVIQSIDALRTDGSAANPRTLTFQCGAPEVAAAPPAPVPVPAAAPQTLELSGEANFVTDRADLTPAATAKLDELIAASKDATFANVTVSGYTDSTGSRAHNEGLSRRRAESVLGYLKGHGLKSAAFEAHGFGPDNPVASNATREGRAKNRRVTVTAR